MSHSDQSAKPGPGRATPSGLELKPAYAPADLSAGAAAELPGQFPFGRGLYPDMYRSRLWTMRQYA
ncbi:MAG: methylmalonyl-CoA mutase, partial [Thermoanaerobaculia bacterium]|nr:methylmalonyl-CoA mutase [Thermoanaerobaculia bacterium]